MVKNPNIKWTSSRFTHVGQRMAERNVSTKLIEKPLKNNYAFITTWSANDYDKNLMEILRCIFGF